MNVFTVSSKIILGRQTESGICTLQFPIAKWIEQYGTGGTFHLYNKRSRDTNAYPVVITSDEQYVYWTPTTADVQYAGIGEAQLDYTFGTYGQTGYRKACSEIFKTYVERSIETDSTVPQPYQAWVTQVSGYADSAEESAEDSEAWAVGQRNGVDVPPTDPTYHNNSKWYAEHGGGGGGGTWDYIQLIHKPKINNVELNGNKSTSDLGIVIPTKTSDLTNDSGFLTEHQSLAAYRTSSAQDSIDNTKVDKISGKGLSTNDYDNEEKQKVADAYTKPSTGIPKTDLESVVRESLNKADSSISEPSAEGTDGQVLATDGAGTRYWKTVSGGSGTSDYNDLSNRPRINNIVLTGNKTTSDLGIVVPTKTSDLQNDGDGTNAFLTQHQSLAAYRTSSAQDVIDSTKANSADLSAVATSGNYDDLSNKPTIPVVPTNVSAFTNDAGYLTSHQSLSAYRTASAQDIIDAEKANTADLALVATSGSYNDLSNKPTIPVVPTNVSAFTNDAGYLTSHQSLLAYRTSSDQDVIDSGKQATLVSGTNIKTINNQSVLGSGNITISGGGAVDSVNGQTGTVVLDGADINVDDTAATPQTIASALSSQSAEIGKLDESIVIDGTATANTKLEVDTSGSGTTKTIYETSEVYNKTETNNLLAGLIKKATVYNQRTTLRANEVIEIPYSLPADCTTQLAINMVNSWPAATWTNAYVLVKRVDYDDNKVQIFSGSSQDFVIVLELIYI